MSLRRRKEVEESRPKARKRPPESLKKPLKPTAEAEPEPHATYEMHDIGIDEM